MNYSNKLLLSLNEDEKVDFSPELTNMEFVNKHRNFNFNIHSSELALEAVFLKLRERCGDSSWKPEFEDRARELHGKIMILEGGRPAKHIDPHGNYSTEGKDHDSEVERLMAHPENWSMETKEKAVELHEILRHFTMYAPFEGRPFIRAWLEALTPCISRWILSYTNHDLVKKTLKHFLGAFGQPGIVVCLEDKGASILKTLQRCARSVEAHGRGTVERYYWKCLAEASCGLREEWQELESIENKPLQSSQLDKLATNWLQDGNDWVPVFASIVSPEISERFWNKIDKLTCGREAEGWKAIPGPPKTRARTLAKAIEYQAEFAKEENAKRRSRFFEKFEKVYGRKPNKPEDYIWNIVDFARCSITVPSAREVLQVKRMIEKEFSVVCVKNGYSSNFCVTGSGYRDLKLLVEVEFENLNLAGITHTEEKTTLICEIQILCDEWFENKNTTNISYKILRAKSLCYLLYDCEKYSKPTAKEDFSKIDVIKNGWVNIAKGVDFSEVNVNKLLLTSTRERWNAVGVRMLVEDLKADMEVRNIDGYTPLIMACKRGSEDVVKLLIDLRCNIESKDNFSCNAITWATENGHEGCVRSLLNARATVEIVKSEGLKSCFFKKTSPRDTFAHNRIISLLAGEDIKRVKKQQHRRSLMFKEMRKAAIEGCLAQFFDKEEREVPMSLVSQLLASRVGVACLENILQILWFGGDIRHKYLKRTPLQMAGKYGTPETIRVLLDAKATVNEPQENGETPLLAATRYGNRKVVKLLLEAKADVNAKTTKGLTPLLHAVKYGNPHLVDLLAESGADINTGVAGLQKMYSCALGNQQHREGVMQVLEIRFPQKSRVK